MKEIQLNKFKGQLGLVAMVGDDDFDLVNQYNWFTYKSTNTYYAITNIYIDGIRKKIKMHRFIMNPEPGKLVDHKDRNGLNNQRSNLRLATNNQNAFNRDVHKDSSNEYKGVHLERKKFRARIKHKGKYLHLGNFNTAIEAAQAYNEAALKYHGEFAKLNSIIDF